MISSELALNQILWPSIHGAGSVMPPRRNGFIRPVEGTDDDREAESRAFDKTEQRRGSR
jgi:hypothetical protein